MLASLWFFRELAHHWWKFIIILHKQSCFERLLILFFFSIPFLYFPPSMNRAVINLGELSRALLKIFGQLLQSYYEPSQCRIMEVWASDPDWHCLIVPWLPLFLRVPYLDASCMALQRVGRSSFLPFHSHLYISLSCLLPLAASSTLNTLRKTYTE